jgi:thymidylate synthase (FAD)
MEIQFKSDIDVELIQHMGSDLAIAAAARVYKPDAYKKYLEDGGSPKDAGGLINYMAKHRHGTPFEHNGVTFFVNAPIFVWREWHRHRIAWSYNEESARYKQLDPVFYVANRDRPMMKVDGWKPGRPKFTVIDTGKFEDLKFYKLTDNLKEVYALSYQKYEENLALGVDPGLARDCLPVGIYSACWVTANARSVMAFLSLRTHEPDAKFVSYPLWEIDQAARKVEAIFKELFPITHDAFCKNGRVAP